MILNFLKLEPIPSTYLMHLNIPVDFRDEVLIQIENSQISESLERVPLEQLDVILIQVDRRNRGQTIERLALDGIQLGMLEAHGVEDLHLLEHTGGYVSDAAVAPDNEAQLLDVHLGVKVCPNGIAQFEPVEDQTVGVLGGGELVLVTVAVERRILLLNVTYVDVLLLRHLRRLLATTVLLYHRLAEADAQVQQ